MSMCPDPVESCRKRALAFGALARRTSVLVLVCGPTAFSQQTGGDALTMVDKRTISNQSVSIPSVEAPSAQAASKPSDQPAKDTATIPAPRLIGRRSTKPSRDILRGDTAGPWYQTGLGSLAIVLALIGGVYWIARRWGPALRSTEVGGMRIVARAGLSQRQSLVLVQVGRRLVVVGVSPGRVERVCDISDPQEVAELTGHRQAGRPNDRAGFDKMLHRAEEEFSPADGEEYASSPASTDRAAGTGAVSGLLKRLRGLQQSN